MHTQLPTNLPICQFVNLLRQCDNVIFDRSRVVSSESQVRSLLPAGTVHSARHRRYSSVIVQRRCWRARHVDLPSGKRQGH